MVNISYRVDILELTLGSPPSNTRQLRVFLQQPFETAYCLSWTLRVSQYIEASPVQNPSSQPSSIQDIRPRFFFFSEDAIHYFKGCLALLLPTSLLPRPKYFAAVNRFESRDCYVNVIPRLFFRYKMFKQATRTMILMFFFLLLYSSFSAASPRQREVVREPWNEFTVMSCDLLC